MKNVLDDLRVPIEERSEFPTKNKAMADMTFVRISTYGITIVTPEWIIESIKSKKILNPYSYLHNLQKQIVPDKVQDPPISGTNTEHETSEKTEKMVTPGTLARNQVVTSSSVYGPKYNNPKNKKLNETASDVSKALVFGPKKEKRVREKNGDSDNDNHSDENDNDSSDDSDNNDNDNDVGIIPDDKEKKSITTGAGTSSNNTSNNTSNNGSSSCTGSSSSSSSSSSSNQSSGSGVGTNNGSKVVIDDNIIIPINHNKHITDILKEMTVYYSLLKDNFREMVYNRLCGILEKLPYKILDINEIKKLPGVGNSLGDKIQEILKTGKLEKLENFKNDPKLCALINFSKIWGMGPKGAQILYNLGFRTLQDVKDRGHEHLTGQQRTGKCM